MAGQQNISLKNITPYKGNAKKHSKQQIDNVAESIKQFGFVQPIVVDKDNVIVIGHCRYEAAKKLKLTEVPCVCVEDLNEEQVQKLRLLDNKLNESEWNFDLLAEQIPELDFSGFDVDWELKDGKEDKEQAEVEFTEVLGEENNYIILQFKSDIDWLQAESFFELKTVKAMSTRNDGEIKKEMERKGVGRVLDGAKFIEKMMR